MNKTFCDLLECIDLLINWKYQSQIELLQGPDEDTDTEECSNDKQVLLLPLRALYELVGADYFIIMCVHTVVGNQVIVRGINQQFVSAIVNTLSKLLPVGCSLVTTGNMGFLNLIIISD